MATEPRQKPSSIRLAVPLLTRAVFFVAIFLVFSATIGQRIINHGLVNKDGFQIYGGSGKALLFGMLAFLLLAWRNGSVIKLQRWHWRSGVWIILALLAISGAWVGLDKLVGHPHAVIWALLVHACLLGSLVFAAGGTFGPSNLRRLAKAYKRELLVALGLAILFYGFLYVVYDLWRGLATIVLHSVSGLMGVIGIHSTIVPPRTLLFSKFGINIAQYCSGIESIALFTALYALIGVLDWRRFDHRRLLYAFPAALLVLFILNILRVFVLILAGYYINPQIAFSLFHTYAGMLFFILYSVLFWAVSYQWLLQD